MDNDSSRVKELKARKQAILDAKEEKEKKRAEALAVLGKFDFYKYDPSPKQREFHVCEARLRFVLGANSSGKTVAGANEACKWLMKDHAFKPWLSKVRGPIHGIAVVVSRKQQKLPGGPQAKLLQWLPEEAIARKSNGNLDIDYTPEDAIDVLHLKNGSSITFVTANSSRETWQGARFNFAWIDEECIRNNTTWFELVTRVPEKTADTEEFPELGRIYIWLTATPNINNRTWMQDDIYPKCNKVENPDYRLFQMSLDDNIHMSQQAKDDIMNDLSGADSLEYAARVYGGWESRRGLIYPMFSKKVHVIPPIEPDILRRAKGIWRVIDPHEAKPIAVAWYAVLHDGRIVQFDEMNIQGLARQVVKWTFERSVDFEHLVVENTFDYAGNKKTRTGDGKSIREEFTDGGMHLTNCVKSVSAGINEVKRVLYWTNDQAPMFFVTANCTETLSEYTGYSWQQNNRSQPEKKKDEFMDTTRYFFHSKSLKPYLGEGGRFALPKTANAETNTINKAKKARLDRRKRTLSPAIGVGRKR